MRPSDDEILLILAAGRTGTVFIEDALSRHFKELICRHEPPGSRALLMLGNFRNATGRGGHALRRRFESVHEARLAAIPDGSRYLEINPMLCPVTDVVADWAAKTNRTLRVVHLVREPRSWARSIRAFKASARFRHLIDYVPYANPFPFPRPEPWSRLPPEVKALWRWRFCNERIAAIEPVCTQFATLRYEDLFSSNDGVRRATADRLLETFAIEKPRHVDGTALDWFGIDERINPAPRRSASTSTRSEPREIDEDLVSPICGDLMAQFGYGRSGDSNE